MRLILILIAGILTAYMAKGQSQFENVYAGFTAMKNPLVALHDSRVMCSISNGPGFTYLADNGDLLESHSYWNDSISRTPTVCEISNGKIGFVSTFRKDSCTLFNNWVIPQNYPLIGQLDTIGSILSASYYILNGSNCLNRAVNIEILANQGLLLSGNGTSVFPSMFLLQIDSLFNPLWAKTFSNHGEVAFVKQTPNGHLLAGFQLDSAGASIVKLDSTGNILWAHSYFPDGIIKDCIIESDSSYIVTGYTQHYTALGALPANYQPQLFIMKLNQDGQVLWCKGYDSAPNRWYTTRGQHIEPTLDGNYVVLGNLGNTGSNSGRYPFLMKTDLNGDSLWTATAGGKYSTTYETSDLLAVSDGGFMFSGALFGSQPQVSSGAPFIYKTDSMGKLPCLSSWHPTAINTLFPTDSAITLSWSSGATRHPAFVTDTVFAPVVHYDACLVTNDVPSYSTNRRRFRVRPNPNAGQFTVSFEQPLQAKSFYSVYDEMGRLLFERPLRKGSQIEDIDLSGFGKGLYLVKLTEGDSVQTERVVVE